MSKIQAFDFSVNLMKALLWQYNDATRLQSLLQQKQDWYGENQEQFWSDWYRDVFDLRTANEFGLTVWSIILELPLVIDIAPAAPTQAAFGFGQYNKNFTNGNFKLINGGSQVLTPEQARVALRLRYFQLTTRGTIPEINRFMKYLFEGQPGSVWCIDGSDPMTIVYVFSFVPSSQLQFVLQKYDLLPRPAAVGYSYRVEAEETWGFDQYHENFDNGNFGIGT